MGTQHLLPDLDSFKILSQTLIKTYLKKLFLDFSVASRLLLIGTNGSRGRDSLKHRGT